MPIGTAVTFQSAEITLQDLMGGGHDIAPKITGTKSFSDFSWRW